MKQLDQEMTKILNNLMKTTEAEKKVSRFKLFVKSEDGHSRTVGTATLNEGRNSYWINLYMFPHLSISLYSSQQNPKQYLLSVKRFESKTNGKAKKFYNIIGSAQVLAEKGYFELNFDLLDKKVFMSIYPDEPSIAKNQPTLREVA